MGRDDLSNKHMNDVPCAFAEASAKAQGTSSFSTCTLNFVLNDLLRQRIKIIGFRPILISSLNFLEILTVTTEENVDLIFEIDVNKT